LIDTDQELLEQARSGDQEAFRALVERYEAQVAGVVHGMLGPGRDAEDAGQETFLRFYRTLERFRGEAGLGTYLTRIAMNVSLDMLRSRKRRWFHFSAAPPDGDLGEQEPRSSGDEDIEARERRELVHRALGRLDAKQRSVVVLRMLEGYSTRETAELLDIPQGTVLSRLARAQGKLRSLLAPLIQDEPPRGERSGADP